MKRTISVMVGKGSVAHNSRVFHASNTDPQRSHLNVAFCNEPIQEVYHQLFDEALKRYNEKQTRSDRVIQDYFEKIRSGKQEKPFHEVILQIGDKDTMGAATESGQLAATVLKEYMRDFQERNPHLRVFSAHLHMDEATPHLHIDFVPFTTGSKRGMDTRVSLKKALAAQGFQGGTRGDTEWSQWVRSEKEQLAAVMERHGIEWEGKGTHNEHLSVLDYKKEQRAQELAQLEERVEEEKQTLQAVGKALKVQDTVSHTFAEIEDMGRRTLTGKLELTRQEGEKLKNLAKKGVIADAEVHRLTEKLQTAQRSTQIWKQRYEALLEQTKDFLAALKRAPERVMELIRSVIQETCSRTGRRPKEIEKGRDR